MLVYETISVYNGSLNSTGKTSTTSVVQLLLVYPPCSWALTNRSSPGNREAGIQKYKDKKAAAYVVAKDHIAAMIAPEPDLPFTLQKLRKLPFQGHSVDCRNTCTDSLDEAVFAFHRMPTDFTQQTLDSQVRWIGTTAWTRGSTAWMSQLYFKCSERFQLRNKFSMTVTLPRCTAKSLDDI